jgi:chaperonin GroES
MNLQPIHGRVLVRPSEAGDKTPGGIYIPDTAKGRLQEGEIVAVAEDATDEVAVGDRVIYKEFGGTEVRVDGEDYILFTEDDLLAKYVAVDAIPE